MRDYLTAVIPVMCKNGAWGDASSGRRLITENAVNGIVTYSSESMDYLNQRLKEKVYSYSIQTADDKFIFTVWCAERINKHGLAWDEVYSSAFTPFSSQVIQQGLYNIDFWLGPEGAALISNDMLFRKTNAASLHTLFRKLWKCNATELNLPSDPLTLLVKWKDGSLLSELNEARDKSKRIKRRLYGVEIEFTGISRDKAARIVADCLSSTKHYDGGTYRKHTIKDTRNRIWTVERDSSITPSDTRNRTGSKLDHYKCELVTPILTFNDLSLLEKIVATLKDSGAEVNESCGIHVHVDVNDYSAYNLRNLVNICASKEHLLKHALNVFPERERWCKDAEQSFVQTLNKNYKDLTMHSIRSYWYH